MPEDPGTVVDGTWWGVSGLNRRPTDYENDAERS
jgi:hypothetical protein